MITDQQITEILYNSLSDKEKEQVNLVAYCLMKFKIKRKQAPSNKIIRYCKRFNKKRK